MRKIWYPIYGDIVKMVNWKKIFRDFFHYFVSVNRNFSESWSKHAWYQLFMFFFAILFLSSSVQRPWFRYWFCLAVRVKNKTAIDFPVNINNEFGSLWHNRRALWVFFYSIECYGIYGLFGNKLWFIGYFYSLLSTSIILVLHGYGTICKLKLYILF